jgi:hypothetical protein
MELACNASVLLGGNIFPFVKHLKITLNLSLPWTRILSNFPATEVLNISSSRRSGELSDPHLPLDELLPTLREYSGPEELLQFLVPIPTLRRVSVLQWTAGIFDNITAQLEGLAETNNVTSVQAEMHRLDTRYFESFCVLCGVFPRLTELYVKIFAEYNGWDDIVLFKVPILESDAPYLIFPPARRFLGGIGTRSTAPYEPPEACDPLGI